MKILLADDDSAIVNLVTRWMTRAGHETVCASDGRQALELWDSHGGTFDAIVTDMRMPKMDGLNLLKSLRARECTTPVIVMTGRSDETNPTEIQQLSPARVVAKPFTLQTLSAEIEALVQEAS